MIDLSILCSMLRLVIINATGQHGNIKQKALHSKWKKNCSCRWIKIINWQQILLTIQIVIYAYLNLTVRMINTGYRLIMFYTHFTIQKQAIKIYFVDSFKVSTILYRCLTPFLNNLHLVTKYHIFWQYGKK